MFRTYVNYLDLLVFFAFVFLLSGADQRRIQRLSIPQITAPFRWFHRMEPADVSVCQSGSRS